MIEFFRTVRPMDMADSWMIEPGDIMRCRCGVIAFRALRYVHLYETLTAEALELGNGNVIVPGDNLNCWHCHTYLGHRMNDSKRWTKIHEVMPTK